MGVDSHLVEHRFFGFVASLIAALIHLDQKRFRFQYRSIGPVVCSFIE
jgi:hypothetical protein